MIGGPGAFARRFDVNGHVNNLAYLRWMQDSATAHSAAFAGEALTVLTWLRARGAHSRRVQVRVPARARRKGRAAGTCITGIEELGSDATFRRAEKSRLSPISESRV